MSVCKLPTWRFFVWGEKGGTRAHALLVQPDGAGGRLLMTACQRARGHFHPAGTDYPRCKTCQRELLIMEHNGELPRSPRGTQTRFKYHGGGPGAA